MDFEPDRRTGGTRPVPRRSFRRWLLAVTSLWCAACAGAAPHASHVPHPHESSESRTETADRSAPVLPSTDLLCEPVSAWAWSAPEALQEAAALLDEAVIAEDAEAVLLGAGRVLHDAWRYLEDALHDVEGEAASEATRLRRSVLRELMSGSPALIMDGPLGLRPSDPLLRTLAWAALLQDDSALALHWMNHAAPNSALFDEDLLCRARLLRINDAPLGDILDWLPDGDFARVMGRSSPGVGED